jgi:hypothetical protein
LSTCACCRVLEQRRSGGAWRQPRSMLLRGLLKNSAADCSHAFGSVPRLIVGLALGVFLSASRPRGHQRAPLVESPRWQARLGLIAVDCGRAGFRGLTWEIRAFPLETYQHVRQAAWRWTSVTASAQGSRLSNVGAPSPASCRRSVAETVKFGSDVIISPTEADAS